MPDNPSQNADTEADFSPMFVDREDYPVPKVTVVGVEHALTCKICFVHKMLFISRSSTLC